jgi:hypothetical protein
VESRLRAPTEMEESAAIQPDHEVRAAPFAPGCSRAALNPATKRDSVSEIAPRASITSINWNCPVVAWA